MNGATVKAAKKPKTTVGMPANTSNKGLAICLNFGEAYSLKQMAESKPIGVATTTAMSVMSIVPVRSGINPKTLPASSPVALNGDQWVPNRKSEGLTSLKKRNYYFLSISFDKMGCFSFMILVTVMCIQIKHAADNSSMKIQELDQIPVLVNK